MNARMALGRFWESAGGLGKGGRGGFCVFFVFFSTLVFFALSFFVVVVDVCLFPATYMTFFFLELFETQRGHENIRRMWVFALSTRLLLFFLPCYFFLLCLL